MRFEAAAGNGNTVRVWASELEANTLEQAKTTARSPIVAGPVALMADAHLGYGSTVGSVIPTQGAVCPSCIGVDIGCGMGAIRLNRTADDLDAPTVQRRILDGIARAVPAGPGEGHDGGVDAGRRWLDAHPVPVTLGDRARRRALDQLGSLGSGNHFVEVCVDEAARVWAVLHSGSRGVGKEIAEHFIRQAKQVCRDHARQLEDPDLAYFLAGDEGYARYLDAMGWAQDYAWENRRLMLDAVEGVLRRHLPGDDELQVVERVLCHHNYTALEQHAGRELWVTRKGAIRAAAGEPGIIPGSMATGSFVVEGLGNPASYESASHGAGRRLSRGAARRGITAEALREAMAGRTWLDGHAAALVDEAPDAYKPLGQVMSDQADLVRPRHRLETVINYKGIEARRARRGSRRG